MLGYFVTAFTFIGTLIGAGFASGKEIALFFGDAGVPSVLLAGIACGSIAYPFMRIGALTGGNVAKGVFHSHPEYAELVLRFVNFLVLATVLAAAEYLAYELFGFHGGAVVTGIAALIANSSGMRGIKAVNAVLVPVIIALVVLILSRKGFSPVTGRVRVLSPLLYSAMNALSAGLVTAKISGSLTRKGALCVSAIIAASVSALLLMVRSAIVGSADSDMPLYSTSLNNGLGIAGAVVIYSAIFTTAAGTLGVAAKENSAFSPIITVSFAFLVSSVGFGNLVKYTYPFIGAVGAGFAALATFMLARKKIRQCPCNNTSILVQYERRN